MERDGVFMRIIKKRKNKYKKIYNSFNEAKDGEDEYYLSLSYQERLSDLQFCREQYFKLKPHEDRKGLRGFIKIIKQE